MDEREGAASAVVASRRERPAVHLLWAVPLAVVVAGGVTLLAAVAWCGVSGCSGGGFGADTSARWFGWVLLLGAGAVLAAPVAVVGWTARRRVRAAAGVAVGLGWVVWSSLRLGGAA